MKIMYVVCKKCGYARKETIYDPEEASQKNLKLVPSVCQKCGSRDIELRD